MELHGGRGRRDEGGVMGEELWGRREEGGGRRDDNERMYTDDQNVCIIQCLQ